MGGPEMAPHTPPSASRSSQGLDRSGGQPVSAMDGASADPAAPAGPGEAVVVTQAQVRVSESELAGGGRDTLLLTAKERRRGRRAAAHGPGARCRSPAAGPTVRSPDPALLPLLNSAAGLSPAGGFAHSFGLEPYVRGGRVRDRGGSEAFTAAPLGGSAGPADAAAAAIAA